MRTDVSGPNAQQATLAAPVVTLFPDATPVDLIVGSVGLTVRDLTPYVQSLTQSELEMTLQLRYNRELSGANRPASGQLVQLRDGTDVLFNGIIDTISNEREVRGDRAMDVVVRRRDAFPWWRDVHAVSEVFGVGADLGAVARSVAKNNLGLIDQETQLPNLGITVVHDTIQFSDVTALEMLQTILEPALAEPYIDAVGRVKIISRNLERDPSVNLTWAQVGAMEYSGSRLPLTAVKVKWLDPELTEVVQANQPLAQAQLTCGVFLPASQTEVFWSADRRQRAKNTSLQVTQSLGIVGHDWYHAVGDYGGRIYCEVSAEWVALFGGSIAALYAAHQIPEPVQVGVTGTGATIPWYKAAATQAAEVGVWLAVARQAIGVYEVWGQPFDFVHAVNEVEAYDESAPVYAQKVEVVENYLIPDEDGARALAVNELIYRARAASSGTVRMTDDHRVERGDVLGLPDGRRFYVTGYRRQYTRGDTFKYSVGGFYL